MYGLKQHKLIKSLLNKFRSQRPDHNQVSEYGRHKRVEFLLQSRSVYSSGNFDRDESSTSKIANDLNEQKSQRLMRQIYSRVHPDLFTNHLHAQKQNEDSLKVLRNLIDSFANFQSQNSKYYRPNPNEDPRKKLNFYKKIGSQVDTKLKKFEISLSKSSYHTIKDQLEYIFNQLIDNLELPVKKFKSDPFNKNDKSKLPSFLRNHGNQKYRVTYKNVKVRYNFDEYVTDEEFKEWYEENLKQNQIPSLRKWINDNNKQINSKLQETSSMRDQLNKNKNIIINKWKLNNIIFDSNWSLKNYNSYLLGMKNYQTKIDFEGFTLVLTNNRPGLQKNGQIFLNCDQVYEEWLFVMAQAKKETNLLQEIIEMEFNLSSLLNRIKVCDNLDKGSLANSGDDRQKISSAFYYHKLLNIILNNLTREFIPENIDLIKLKSSNDFSNLNLTFQNINNIDINSAGQFVIGRSRRFNHNEVVNFIKENRKQSLELYKNYIESKEIERKKLAVLKDLLGSSQISFDDSLNLKEKLKTMEKLINLAKRKDSRDQETLLMLKRVNLIIARKFALNDDASLQIPWNWFDNDENE